MFAMLTLCCHVADADAAAAVDDCHAMPPAAFADAAACYAFAMMPRRYAIPIAYVPPFAARKMLLLRHDIACRFARRQHRIARPRF